MGDYDECGICNGPGDIYECIRALTYPKTIATAMATNSMCSVYEAECYCEEDLDEDGICDERLHG